MAKQSAGLLLYRYVHGTLQVFLVHPGGPFFARKDAGVWSVPKGEFDPLEDPLDAAKREFQEETGFDLPVEFVALSPIKQKSGKQVYVWACPHDVAPGALRSNTFEMEWPPRSGARQSFPEIDRGDWFALAEAGTKINAGQLPLLNELAARLDPTVS